MPVGGIPLTGFNSSFREIIMTDIETNSPKISGIHQLLACESLDDPFENRNPSVL